MDGPMDYQMAKIGTKGRPRIDVRTSKRMPDQMEMTNTINFIN